jgi:hypothetical protein
MSFLSQQSANLTQCDAKIAFHPRRLWTLESEQGAIRCGEWRCFVWVHRSAATIDAIEGQVLINHGEGFQRVVAATEAREGDLVMANPGGSAKLIYPGGCAIEIQPGSVITVGDGSQPTGNVDRRRR